MEEVVFEFEELFDQDTNDWKKVVIKIDQFKAYYENDHWELTWDNVNITIDGEISPVIKSNAYAWKIVYYSINKYLEKDDDYYRNFSNNWSIFDTLYKNSNKIYMYNKIIDKDEN